MEVIRALEGVFLPRATPAGYSLTSCDTNEGNCAMTRWTLIYLAPILLFGCSENTTPRRTVPRTSYLDAGSSDSDAGSEDSDAGS
jgi:hypothetical protein